MIYKHELPPIEFKPVEKPKHKSQWELQLEKQVESPALEVKFDNPGKLRDKHKPIEWV